MVNNDKTTNRERGSLLINYFAHIKRPSMHVLVKIVLPVSPFTL